jgi:mono/diheme cytochrome c family protein
MARAEMKHLIIDLVVAPFRDGRTFVGAVVSGVAFIASVGSPSLANAALASDPSRLPAATTGSVDFEREIKPLFESACVKCHGPEKAKNGFRIDSRSHALAGGDHGVDIIPGDSAKSPLVHFVAGLVPDMEMPPKGKGEPFTAAQVGLLRAWIDQGAKWDREEIADEVRKQVDKTDWWSLKPLIKPVLPQPANRESEVVNPIDAFVLAKLAEKGLRPSPQADRRTLIRRLYFDLIGLPPKPEEIETFAADKDAKAYEKLVERLLASPHYGERWARHWLDVVHYGETHGYDKDQPRPNAWPYRDYVIRSFNEDKPYTRFVQEQLAGDVLFPGTRDGFEALGFIAAGPWDLIGHAEVPESKMDGMVARHLDRDDMVANTMQTFNSLTVQCAQCHNHKFDPIAQEDYYSLQAVFAAVDRADKKYDVAPATARQRKELTDRQTALATRRKELDTKILARAGQPLVDLDQKIAALTKAAKSSDANGYHSSIEKKQDTAKWVQVDLGRSVALGSVVLHPCKDDFNGIGEGFGFPVRFKIEVSDNAGFKDGVTMVGDYTKEDFTNPKLKALSLDAGGRSARFIRVTATKLALRQNDYIFALAELNALTPDGNNVALGAVVSALDSIEAPVRWQKVNLTDGWQPGASVADSGELVALRKDREALLARATPDDDKNALAGMDRDLATVKTELGKLPPQSTAYVAAIYSGAGSFSGTGAKGGKPRPIHVLNRGSVQKPGKEVGPGTLNCLPGLPSRFELPPNHVEGERRAALAQWLTRVDNPLTWRSIVNRVWQYHFGRGLVETPNDFGRMGGLPTHPELVDWLAAEFRDGGQSFKALHKLIVTSATYRQESGAGDQESAAQIDSDNRYLWRANRRKLEAEAVRDAVLFVSGKLDSKMGGPSFKDFVIDKPEHSPHYEYHLHDPEDPKSHRRSIYRFIVRSQQQPFMTTLDCADPSMQVGRRNESLSPLQALAMMNNSLILTMSKHFAAKIEKQEGDWSDKVRAAYFEAVGRAPSKEDAEVLTQYAKEHGLANLCRVLFNLNEFSFVD